jgi:hypothetical protein
LAGGSSEAGRNKRRADQIFGIDIFIGAEPTLNPLLGGPVLSLSKGLGVGLPGAIASASWI